MVPVAAVASTVIAVLLAVARRYGWHRDELYFLAAGRHLAWGYVDQPPFTPAIARLCDVVAPGNLVALRTFPALAAAGTVVLGALIVRELGADRRTQVLAAAAVAGGGFALGSGHLLSTAAFDLLAWMMLLWITTRLLRTGSTRLWVAFGVVAGLALMNKDLVPLLIASLAIGLIADRRFDLLRTWWLAAGVGVASVIAAPNLIWQAQHGWPQLAMAHALSARLAGVNRATLIPLQAVMLGVPLLWPLCAGILYLARTERGRRFRPLLWAWPSAIVASFATAGRPYYVLPLTITVMLAGIVSISNAARRRWVAPAIGVAALGALVGGVPVLPLASTVDLHLTAVNETFAETVGWPQLVDQTAAVARGLPAADQAHLVLLTGSYGEAGAIDRFGPARGLPPAYSPHNSYPDFRRPTDDHATVLAIRLSQTWLTHWFDECTQIATIDNHLQVTNEAQGQPIILCHGLHGTWQTDWPHMRFLS